MSAVTEDKPAPSSTRLRCFASVSPGLEPFLAQELQALGHRTKLLCGGVEFSGTLGDLNQVCASSRLAESVRVRLKTFSAAHFNQLEEGLQKLPWHAYLRPSLATHLAVTCRKSRLFHSNAVLERAHRIIEAKLRTQLPLVSRTDAAQTVFLRLDHDEVEVSIDASGELLHRRGYRTHIGNAPLRETLAAALIRVADAPQATHLWDPFCGSGTIPLEWLSLHHGYPTPPRRYAFEQWPTFSTETVPARETQSIVAVQRAFGSDIHDKSLAAARVNADQLGATQHVTWLYDDFAAAATHVPQNAVVITNPPYGKRVGDNRQVLTLHRRFETLLKTRRDLRPAVMACGFAPFLGAMTLPWERVASTKNGGLPLTILRLK